MDTLMRRCAVQRNLDRLEEWTSMNLDVQSRQMQSPASRKTPAVVQAGKQLSGEQPCGDGPEVPGGQQTEHEPGAACLGSN